MFVGLSTAAVAILSATTHLPGCFVSLLFVWSKHVCGRRLIYGAGRDLLNYYPSARVGRRSLPFLWRLYACVMFPSCVACAFSRLYYARRLRVRAVRTRAKCFTFAWHIRVRGVRAQGLFAAIAIVCVRDVPFVCSVCLCGVGVCAEFVCRRHFVV